MKPPPPLAHRPHLAPPARKSLQALGLLLMGLSACDATDPVVCTTEFVYGLAVTAVDAGTGDPVSAGLSGTATAPGYTEEMAVLGNRLLGAGERAGTYDVTVTAPGYAPWVRQEVVVTADVCHVETVSLTADLIPS